MCYKLAVVSTDGVKIDQSFGGASAFCIYEVNAEGWHLAETREVPHDERTSEQANSCSSSGCGTNARKGCTGARTGGCNGELLGIALVGDCRAVIATRIGFNAVKQLEKKAIATFDVECEVLDALQKITEYFRRVDAHESLRGIRNKEKA